MARWRRCGDWAPPIAPKWFGGRTAFVRLGTAAVRFRCLEPGRTRNYWRRPRPSAALKADGAESTTLVSFMSVACPGPGMRRCSSPMSAGAMSRGGGRQDATRLSLSGRPFHHERAHPLAQPGGGRRLHRLGPRPVRCHGAACHRRGLTSTSCRRTRAERTAGAYGPNLERLRAVKTRWDPEKPVLRQPEHPARADAVGRPPVLRRAV